ncbi:helix-turn-helix transcriptional regulator [Plantactinospora sp. S1510]|uniref:Helix-turn-helix transcriptional regulator n=1 Tax=Plantactinospora alkalitolerans TaxID=2789879 RepID=A0ABS0GXW4_9ACTN|nr:helix-turn-helix transcriptional regulator [Plantactinospora alkalitolerans]MBF9131042.1 helix-turn-helix transcriptional regulator [Plantactinospora alkalitolerans]
MGSPFSEFLLRELRRTRLAAGLNQDEMGKLINFSGSHVSAVEVGTRPLKLDYLRAVDKAFKTGGLFERMWKELSGLDDEPSWVRERAAMERDAVLLRWYEHAYVPGLLQTEEYARAVFTSNPALRTAEVEKRVAARLERRRILDVADPPQIVAVLDEEALRRPIGGAKVMREQCLELARLGEEHPRLRLHVVPAGVGAYPGLDGQFVIATMPGDEEIAYLDNPLQGQVTVRPEEVELLRRHWEAILSEALPPQQSVEKFREVAERWT